MSSLDARLSAPTCALDRPQRTHLTEVFERHGVDAGAREEVAMVLANIDQLDGLTAARRVIETHIPGFAPGSSVVSELFLAAGRIGYLGHAALNSKDSNATRLN